jgi:hypothetical protein
VRVLIDGPDFTATRVAETLTITATDSFYLNYDIAPVGMSTFGSVTLVTTDGAVDAHEEIAVALAAAIKADAADATPTDYKAEAGDETLYVGTLSGALIPVSFTPGASGSATTEIPYNFTAIAEGDTLVIVNRADDSFTPTFDIIPSGAGAVDAETPISAAAVLTGTPIVDETWYIVLTIDGAIHAFSHVVVDDGTVDTLSEIAIGLVSEINAAALPGFVATTEGDILILISQDGEAFSTASEITHADGTSAGALLVDDSTATAALANLSGTQAAGEVWSVLLTVGEESTLVSHTVLDTDGDPEPPHTPETLAEIATALAAGINAIELDDFVATTEGDTLIIVSLTGAEFTVETAIVPTRRPAGLSVVTAIPNPIPDTNDFATQVVSLGGTVRVDQVWNLVLTVDDVTSVFSYTADSGDNLTDIAAALAGELVNNAETGFAASAEGETIYITDRFARVFDVDVELLQPVFATIDDGTALTTTVELSGDPNAGEVWFLTIDDLFFEVTVNDPPESLVTIAGLLADLINARMNAADFTAWAEGEAIVIANRVGDVFETTTQAQSVTRRAGEAGTLADPLRLR